MALDGERAVPGNELFQGQGADVFKEGIEVGGVEPAQHQQHPFAGAEVQIDPGDIGRGCVTEDPSVFRPDVAQVQAAQLIGGDALQPEQSGNGKLQLCHK